MSRLIRLGALVGPVVILSAVFFGGCAAPEMSRRASVLALPYLQFDQTFGLRLALAFRESKVFEGGGPG